MKHSIYLEGFAYSLRPVELEDAEFIIEVREPHRSRFMSDIERSIEAQRKWLENYLQSAQVYYFVVERKMDRRPEGLARLLDFDAIDRSVQWGSLILRPDSLAAAETAVLILNLAFNTLDVNKVWGVPLRANKRMIAYIESLGFEQEEIISVPVDGKMLDGTRHVLTKDRWKNFEKKATGISRGIADKLQSRK